VCFSRLLVLRRPKLRLRFAKPAESQRSRSRFHWRPAPKQPTRNIVAKKRAHQEDVDSDYLFGNRLSTLPSRVARWLLVPAPEPSPWRAETAGQRVSERAAERDRHQESYFDVLADLQNAKLGIFACDREKTPSRVTFSVVNFRSAISAIVPECPRPS
jgi:hypothetical protein